MSDNIARKNGALIFSESNGKFINANKIESYKKKMSNELLSDWLLNLDIETMQYINEPLYVQITDNYGNIVKNSEGAKNKLLCAIDLKAALKHDSLLEGAKTLAELKRQKNNFQYDDQKDLLDALIKVAESELIFKFLEENDRKNEINDLNPKNRKRVKLLAEIELLPEMEKNDSLNELLDSLNEQLNDIETKQRNAVDNDQKTLKDAKDFYSYLNKEQKENLKLEARTEIKNNKEKLGYKYTAEMELVDEVDFARDLMKELYPNEYSKYKEDRNNVLNIADENLQYRKQIDLLQAKIEILEEKIKNVKDTDSRFRPL